MAKTYPSLAFGLLVTASPASATLVMTQAVPAAAPNALYCLRMEPITGTRIGSIECRTRDDWAALEVDLDEEWAENGVRVVA
ncbi:MAG TPA: hypothetical protein VM145_07975 [Sphingomicrobium sp.]|nr:hypothetical protein [Sphingomicrobium sp.]